MAETHHPPLTPGASSGPSGAPFEGSIFWNPSEAVDIVEMPLPIITEGTQDMGNGVYWLRAGTPLDEYFAVSNDEDAVYLVAEDFYFISTKPDQAKIVPLITAGYVDINKAEAASGLTYTDDCLSALETAGIVLVDGVISTGGSTVSANPTLAGTEDSLTGLEIDGTKYAVGGSSGGGVLVVHAVPDSTTQTVTLDKTWQEIHDADLSVVVGKASDYAQTHLVTEVIASPSPSGVYTLWTRGSRNGTVASDLWQAASPDDYPVLAST